MLTAIFFLSSFYYINVKYQGIERRRAQFYSLLKYRKNLNNERPNVRVYDLSKPLDASISESIECRQSGEYQRITVTLCLHDKDRDVVSKALWLNGLWEEHIMSKNFLKLFLFTVKISVRFKLDIFNKQEFSPTMLKSIQIG